MYKLIRYPCRHCHHTVPISPIIITVVTIFSSCRPVSFPPIPSAQHLIQHLVLRARVERAANLRSRPQRQPNTTASKQRRRRAIILTQIKVDIRTVLVRTRQAVLRAQRVSRSRAKVVDLDHNSVCAVKSVSAAVGLRSKLVAETAGGTGAGTRANTEEVLRESGVVAWVVVEAAGGGVGVAVGGAEAWIQISWCERDSFEA